VGPQHRAQRVHDERRRHSHTINVEPLDLQDGPDAVPSSMPDPGLRMDLLSALARLSVEQREPLLLVTLEQLSYAECAEVLRIPVGTVMSRVSRGRAVLRALLDGRAPSPAGGRSSLRRII
jgi:RNA polymerase sigma-70 factor (ECF subfamily)